MPRRSAPRIISWAGAPTLAIAAAMGQAQAADIALSGTVSSRLSANFGGDTDSIGLTNDLGLLALARTPRSQVTFAPGLRLALNDEDSLSFDRLRPRFNFGYTFSAPLDTIGVTASFVPSLVSDTRFEDDLLTRRTEDTLQLLASLAANWSRQLDPRDSLSLGLNARRRDFVDDVEGLEPSTTFGGTAGFSRSLDTRSSLSLNGSARQFISDGDTEDTTSLSLSLGGSRQLSPDLDARASLGPSLTLRDGDDPEIGVVGSLGVTWRASADTQLTASLTQDVDQGGDGETASITRLRFGVSHTLDARSRLAASFGLTARTEVFAADRAQIAGEDNADQILLFSPSYNYAVTQDWSVGLGYNLRIENGDSAEVSNGVFLRVSRGLSLLP